MTSRDRAEPHFSTTKYFIYIICCFRCSRAITRNAESMRRQANYILINELRRQKKCGEKRKVIANLIGFESKSADGRQCAGKNNFMRNIVSRSPSLLLNIVISVARPFIQLIEIENAIERRLTARAMRTSREYIQTRTNANSFINRVIGINTDSFRSAHLNHAHRNHSPLPRSSQAADRPGGNVSISHNSSLAQFLLTKRRGEEKTI